MVGRGDRKTEDSITVWYYRAVKEDRPHNSIFRPVWLETSGREEWKKVPRRKIRLDVKG